MVRPPSRALTFTPFSLWKLPTGTTRLEFVTSGRSVAMSSLATGQPSARAAIVLLRSAGGFVREVQGDLRAEHVLFEDDRIEVVDGVEFDPETSYDERKEIWKISSEIYRTINVTQSAVGDKRGWWTTVVGAAVLIPS